MVCSQEHEHLNEHSPRRDGEKNTHISLTLNHPRQLYFAYPISGALAVTLQAPRRFAINFHDGPLPRYAGMHVTSWAIMRGERVHAVTWHVMTGEIDAGPILMQQAVPITPEDSALTLNAKCYDAALESFGVLVDDLGSDRAAPREQDLSQRTYFPLALRPPAAAVIDWTRPAAEISALVRGLGFGSYPNPLDRPKLAHGTAFWICPQVESADTPVAAAVPGTLVVAGPDALVVAAADGLLRIPRLLRLDGTELSLAAMLAETGLQAGDQLARPDALLERATAYAGRTARSEPYWAARLRALRAVPLPFAEVPAASRLVCEYRKPTLPLSLNPLENSWRKRSIA